MSKPDEPAFTNRQYAAIFLCVPDSGEPWLDAMIERSRRDGFAKAAISLASFDEQKAPTDGTYTTIAMRAYLYADALLAEGKK